MLKVAKGRSAWIFVWLFFISLQSYYSYSLGLSVPPVIAAVAAAFLVVSSFVSFRACPASVITPLALFFLFSMCLSLALLMQDINLDNLKRLFVFPFFLLVGCLFSFISYFYRIETVYALKALIVVHLFFFWVQGLFYYIGFGVVDFLAPFNGEMQRVLGGHFPIEALGVVNIIRPSGLYNEPGTFSNFLFLFFLLYRSLANSSGIHVSRWFSVLVCLSVLLSFSIFGLLYVLLYLFFSNRGWSALLKLSPVLILIFIFYVAPRFSMGVDASGIGFRMSALQSYLSYVAEDWSVLLFGIGLFADPAVQLKEFVWNDLGVAFFMLVSTGLLGVGLLLFLIFPFARTGPENFAFMAVFLLSKLSPSMFVFWLILSHLMQGGTFFF